MNPSHSKNIVTLKLALLVSFLFAVLPCAPVGAEAAAKEVEWVITLGCRHCHFAEQTGITKCVGNCGPAASKDGQVFLLSGKTPKDFKKGGTWLVKGTVSADGKAIAVEEMTFQPPTAEELKDNQPAHSAPDAKAFTGPVAHTGAGLPTLTAADKMIYGLKTSKTAPASANRILTRIGGGELTGTFTATGTTYEDDSRKWIVIDSIQAAAATSLP